MTGFGTGEAAGGRVACRVEMGSVNRKQLDIKISLPGPWACMEAGLRERLAAAVLRGRVDVRVSVERLPEAAPVREVRVDRELVRAYVRALREVAGEADGWAAAGQEWDPLALLRLPGVIETVEESVDPREDAPVIEEAFERAVESLLVMRRAEGGRLAVILEGGRQRLLELLSSIGDRAPQVVEHHRRALHQRLAEAGIDLDLEDERLIREVGLFADRCDIREEIDRLRSHLEQLDEFLSGRAGAGEAVGRKLDFLAQELNRECNTIASKANDAALAHLVVDAKTEVERLREQVQNVQ